jgi:cyclopropane fatty-acyl-phospholipid synthase-like methyltransferase
MRLQMFTKKEIDYLKQAVFSDLECNCLPPIDDVLNESHDRFCDIEKDEVDFLKTLYNKLCNI